MLANIEPQPGNSRPAARQSRQILLKIQSRTGVNHQILIHIGGDADVEIVIKPSRNIRHHPRPPAHRRHARQRLEWQPQHVDIANAIRQLLIMAIQHNEEMLAAEGGSVMRDPFLQEQRIIAHGRQSTDVRHSRLP